MRSKKLGVVAGAAVLLGAASAAWGAFDSPNADLFDKVPGVTGDKYTGVVALLFRDYTNVDLTAGGFEAVARLTRGKESHVFRTTYDCEAADPCGICDDASVPDRIDATQVLPIEACLQNLMEDEIVEDFELPGSADVQLRRIETLTSEVDPADTSVRVVVSDIQVAIEEVGSPK
jgi:hypothetical protein